MTRQAVIAVLVLDGEHRCVHGHLRADRCRLPLTSDVVDAGADNCTGPVELHLPLELEGKLAAAASRRGVSVEVLAREALERAVDYDDRSSARSRPAWPRSTPDRP